MKLLINKYWILALAVVSIVGLCCIGPIAQDLSYHNFADKSVVFDLSNFHNVVSNIPFLVCGLLGLAWFYKSNHKFTELEKALNLTTFIGFVLTGLGSSYYHTNPNNATLLWDRLPMAIVFASFFCSVIKDYINAKLAQKIAVIYIPFAIASVFYWAFTEQLAMGDLRWYAFVQFFPLGVITVIIIRCKRQSTKTKFLLLTFGCYILAKLLEHFDAPVYDLIGYSGHSLKHLVASVAMYFIYRYIKC